MTRRRITAPGVKPSQLILPRYESVWLYGAVDPLGGGSFFLEMPDLDAVCYQIFLDHFSHAYPTTMNVLVVDGAPAHIAHCLRIPDNILIVRLPAYSPELNPAERVWQDMRARLNSALPPSLDALADDVAKVICEYTPEMIASLTGYDYLRKAYLAHSV
jgi:hypothetical protein